MIMNKYSTLCLVYTDTCNANCSICSFECSPHKSNKMNVEDAKTYIDEAVECAGVSRLAITGGEALLYYDEILQVINHAYKRGLYVTCNSNGYWARTLDETGIKMLNLIKAGLKQITISVDQYHMQYIPIENIRNIITAAKRLQLHVVLECVVLKNSKRVWDIAKELGDCICDIEIIERLCLPFGAARNINKEEFFTNDINYIKCNYSDVMTILPNKKVYSCCSEGGFTEIMKSADLSKDSIKCAVENYEKNKLMFLIKNLGFSWLIEDIKNNNLNIEVKESYVNVCEACYDLFNNKENIEILNPFIEKKFEEIMNIISG